MKKISKLFVAAILLTIVSGCRSEEVKLEELLLGKLKTSCKSVNELQITSIIKLKENVVKVVESGLADPPEYLEGVFLDINFSNGNYILRPPCDYSSNYFKFGEEYRISGYIVEVMAKNQYPISPHSKVSLLVIDDLVKSK